MRTLVLNAGYEPLGTVPIRRALLLVLNDKASIIEAGQEMIHSAHAEYISPSVVLLRYYVKVPMRSVPLTRRTVLQRYRYICAYCQEYGDTLDHVVPRSRGGQHTWLNVVVACRRCNHRKADRLLSELGWRLPFELTEPAPNHGARSRLPWGRPEWNAYLSYTEPAELLAG